MVNDGFWRGIYPTVGFELPGSRSSSGASWNPREYCQTDPPPVQRKKTIVTISQPLSLPRQEVCGTLGRHQSAYLGFVVCRSIATSTVDYYHAIAGIHSHRNRENILHLALQRCLRRCCGRSPI